MGREHPAGRHPSGLPDAPSGVEVWEGLPYEEDGHPMHTLNLYRPAGVYGPLPTVVDIHGGGWMYGDRQLNRNYCMYLASRATPSWV